MSNTMDFELPKAISKDQKVLIVEGGGMKGAFSGGVLACMCKLFPKENFDLVLGVSAGSCSLAYYV
ncbi:MAG: patatin-like phospholipase family protein [Leptospiraceae bacterium]|nr:patatin-like phospholipase family protein [Leptospiraceae bacterium]